MALVAQEPHEHSRLQSGKLEALDAQLDEGSQVCLADAAYGVDVCTGAVILGQVAEETAREKGQCSHGFWDIEDFGFHQCWPKAPFFQDHRSQKPSITQALEETSRVTLGTLCRCLSWLRMPGYDVSPTGTACLEDQGQLGGAEGQKPQKGR